MLNQTDRMHNLVEDVAVGAMGAHNALNFFKPGVLLITPGDREDIILAACTSLDNANNGMIWRELLLSGNFRTQSESVLKVDPHDKPIPCHARVRRQAITWPRRYTDLTSEDATGRRAENHPHPRPDR